MVKAMRQILTGGVLALLLAEAGTVMADERELVALPPMMQEHMLGNMREHLETIDALLERLALGELDAAAELAEARLGMSSLQGHGAEHLARFMPAPMQAFGTSMHRAASRFARTAEEGEPLAAYRALGEITRACVGCHAAYRIR